MRTLSESAWSVGSTIRSARLILAGLMSLLVVASVSGMASPTVGTAHGSTGDYESVTVTEGTNIAATASPDGESIVMELQGLLFRLPRTGGQTKQLTEIEFEPAHPDYAPDGRRIAVESYADGDYDIWTLSDNGSDRRQVTNAPGPFDDREPRWSPDGTQIAFSSDRSGNYDIWTVDVASGDVRQWTDDPGDQVQPTWSPDGNAIAYIEDNAVKAVDGDGNTRTLVEAASGASLHSPSWGPDGGVASVQVQGTERKTSNLMVSGEPVTEGQDVFAVRPQWLSANDLLYTADGKIRVADTQSGAAEEVSFAATFRLPSLDYDKKDVDLASRRPRKVKGIVTPMLSPDGKEVAFVALNDLWLMRIGKRPRRLTHDNFYEANPAWSRDGRYLAYSSDKGGTEDIYVRDMETGRERQVTALEDAAISAAWSPDGSKIAFQTQELKPGPRGLTAAAAGGGSHGGMVDGSAPASTYTVDLEAGEVELVAGPLRAPGRPTWSADGKTIAMAALDPFSQSGRGLNRILTVDVETGEQTFHSPGGESDSISTREADGPLWSPDGRWMAFVMESTLRVMPVNRNGEQTGPARQISHEATDAPTWSGDSRWLLYLQNGELRMVSRDGSKTRHVPVRLRYQVERPVDRTVIHAGRFWDATSPTVREDVDIVVVNDRIRSVGPHRPGRAPDVDASDLTVIPGLWDAHAHLEHSARILGDRQGRINLAYGITSAVSVGGFAYRAVENREAVAAGERVGSRYFPTGELFGGSSISWAWERPFASDEQLELDLSRARALDYDVLKTYVRLDAGRMRQATDAAHELGIPVQSHYLSPGALVGQDGTTHMTGGGRHTQTKMESATDQAYSDVSQIAGQGKRSVMTTMPSVNFLLGDEFKDDPRLDLFPRWERDLLLADVADNKAVLADPACESDVCKMVRTAARIRDQGGAILTGSDSPCCAQLGVRVHSDLRALVTFGWSPYEALLTATRTPAERLGVADDLGTLERGNLADMIFVGGNPLKRIEDAMRVKLVMKNGELVTREEITRPYSE